MCYDVRGQREFGFWHYIIYIKMNKTLKKVIIQAKILKKRTK